MVLPLRLAPGPAVVALPCAVWPMRRVVVALLALVALLVAFEARLLASLPAPALHLGHPPHAHRAAPIETTDCDNDEPNPCEVDP